MHELAITYMEVGLTMLKENYRLCKEELDKYMRVDLADPMQVRRCVDMKKNGYDLNKETEKIVDFEIAIQDLTNHIYLLKKKK